MVEIILEHLSEAIALDSLYCENYVQGTMS